MSRQANPGATPASVPPYPPPQQAETNSLAIASFVLSLGFCTVIGAAVGIVLGILALLQIRAGGDRQRGAGLALTGILLGGAWVTIIAGALISLFVLEPAKWRRIGRGNRAYSESRADLSHLASACQEYAKDHESRTPERLSQLYPDYIKDFDVFVHCTTGHTIESPEQIDSQADYVLVPDLDVGTDGDKVLAYDKPGNQPKGIYSSVYVNGTTRQDVAE